MFCLLSGRRAGAGLKTGVSFSSQRPIFKVTTMRRSLVCAALFAAVASAFAQEPKPADKPAEKPADKPAAASTGDGLHPRVKFETSLGDFVLELDAEKAPITVDNFVRYVEDKFFDGLIFHRVMPNFMIQGGGFTPDFKQKTEDQRPPIKNEWQNGLKNQKGTIAMARTSMPDSATSQFFINVVDNGMLDQPRGGAAYCVFGKVVDGMDTIEKIRTTPTKASRMNPQEPSEPETPPVIKSATMLTKFDREAATAKQKAAAAAAREGWMKANADTIKKIEEETGKKVEWTASGLGSVVLKEGTGDAKPTENDIAVCHYTGTFPDGKKFDSSVDRGTPLEFPINPAKRQGMPVIKGWQEGVALMKVGEKRKFIIPADLAYGKSGRPGIPGDATLIFEIELVEIK